MSQGFQKESELLTKYFAPERRTQKKEYDLQSILSKNSLDFEKYILENKEVIWEIFQDSETLMHALIISTNFSRHKFVFLVRNGADLHLPNKKYQTFIEKLIDLLKDPGKALSLGNKYTIILNHLMTNFFAENIASRLSVFLECVNKFDEMSKFRGSLPKLLKQDEVF